MIRIALLLLLTSQAAAHGYIKTFTLDGTDHEGFRNWNPSPSPSAIGWPFTTPDEGPELDPASPDMICSRGATPAANPGTVTAGSTMLIHWTSADPVLSPEGWAHSGPTPTYLAPCHGSCAEVDKSTLRWTKIQESGLVSGPANADGLWASDVLRANGGVIEATVPRDIAPGNYVVRSDIIALHRSILASPSSTHSVATWKFWEMGATPSLDEVSALRSCTVGKTSGCTHTRCMSLQLKQHGLCRGRSYMLGRYGTRRCLDQFILTKTVTGGALPHWRRNRTVKISQS